MSEQSVERERRRYLRVAVDEGLECDIEGVGVVHIVGIGSEGGGMRIITNRELPKEDELQIKLCRGEDSLFDGKAKAVWQESWDFEFCSRYVIGVELLGLSDAERKALVSQIPTVSEPPDEMM